MDRKKRDVNYKVEIILSQIAILSKEASIEIAFTQNLMTSKLPF